MTTLTLDEYHALPATTRAELHQWMKDEGLWGQRIFKMTFGEQEVIAERYVSDPVTGKIKVTPDRLGAMSETATFPIKSPPPPGVLSR